MTDENDKDDGYYERLVEDRAEEEYHEKQLLKKSKAKEIEQ